MSRAEGQTALSVALASEGWRGIVAACAPPVPRHRRVYRHITQRLTRLSRKR